MSGKGSCHPYLRLEDSSELVGYFEFGPGRWVNLNKLASDEELDYSYLWRVFYGGRDPSLLYMKRLAQLLRMSVGDFLAELDRHRAKHADQMAS